MANAYQFLTEDTVIETFKSSRQYTESLTKVCVICKVDKPLTDYYNEKRNDDGKKGKCKQCLQAYNRSMYKKYAHLGKYGECKNCGVHFTRSELRKSSYCLGCNKKDISYHWKKGYLNPSGYRVMHISGRLIPEHRLVMEEYIGRKLYSNETVHHINGVRDDNRLVNLELWVKPQPKGIRVEDAVKWAKEILERYT